jgi:hypothetical protein
MFGKGNRGWRELSCLVMVSFYSFRAETVQLSQRSSFDIVKHCWNLNWNSCRSKNFLNSMPFIKWGSRMKIIRNCWSWLMKVGLSNWREIFDLHQGTMHNDYHWSSVSRVVVCMFSSRRYNYSHVISVKTLDKVFYRSTSVLDFAKWSSLQAKHDRAADQTTSVNETIIVELVNTLARNTANDTFILILKTFHRP